MLNSRLEQFRWFYYFGRPKLKKSSEEIVGSLNELRTPVFFLSTGRSGTRWFAQYLSRFHEMSCFHVIKPSLDSQGIYLLHQFQASVDGEDVIELGNQIFLGARSEFLRYAYKCEKRYVETNNGLTFFAYSLHRLMPQARFIILFRDPFEFIKSGKARGWYDWNRQSDGRLIDYDTRLSIEERIAQQWLDTYKFVDEFASNSGADVRYFDINELSPQSLDQLHEFLDLRSAPKYRLMGKKVNKGSKKIDLDYSFSNEFSLELESMHKLLTQRSKLSDR